MTASSFYSWTNAITVYRKDGLNLFTFARNLGGRHHSDLHRIRASSRLFARGFSIRGKTDMRQLCDGVAI